MDRHEAYLTALETLESVSLKTAKNLMAQNAQNNLLEIAKKGKSLCKRMSNLASGNVVTDNERVLLADQIGRLLRKIENISNADAQFPQVALADVAYIILVSQAFSTVFDR